MPGRRPRLCASGGATCWTKRPGCGRPSARAKPPCRSPRYERKPNVSVILELADGAQPGYVPQVTSTLRFLLRHLDEASFAGVDKAGFPNHVLKAVGTL